MGKSNSDRYEYVPNFNFSKNINDNYSFRSMDITNYNTNITEKVVINDLTLAQFKYFNNGVISNKKFQIKKISSEAKNSEKFKNKDTILCSFISD